MRLTWLGVYINLISRIQILSYFYNDIKALSSMKNFLFIGVFSESFLAHFPNDTEFSVCMQCRCKTAQGMNTNYCKVQQSSSASLHSMLLHIAGTFLFANCSNRYHRKGKSFICTRCLLRTTVGVENFCNRLIRQVSWSASYVARLWMFDFFAIFLFQWWGCL